MQYAFLVYAQIIRGVNEINSLAPRKRLETLRTKKSHYIKIPCEQALRGALAAGREKEGELATTSLEFEAAIHSTKISGNFGPKLSGSVRSNRKSFEKTGPPFEVDYFSRSDQLEFWLNWSRPEFHLQFPCGTPSNEQSDFRQSARSGKEREYKQTLKNSCQG